MRISATVRTYVYFIGPTIAIICSHNSCVIAVGIVGARDYVIIDENIAIFFLLGSTYIIIRLANSRSH